MDDAPTSRPLDGRYRLLRRAGHGGMSDVHVARDEVLGRDVAVKLVRADRLDGPADVARLLREARATAALSHPHVVVVHDVVEDGGDAAIVMEYVTGGTLADRLRREGRLGWREAVDVATAVADGLGAAHAAGLVHRDVKPSNVLIGDDGRVRVADLGIAGRLDGTTQTITVRGSVPYIAPEQATGDPPDPRTDVYALGCVLYHMLAGRPPFGDDTDAVIIGQHLHRVPDAPSVHAPEVPAALDAIVLGMLAKDPADRPADMAEVRSLLERTRTASTGPATAVLPTALAATTTTVVDTGPRRHRGVLLLAAVALLGGLLAWRVLAPDGAEEPSVALPSTPTEPVATTEAPVAEPGPEPTDPPAPSPTPTEPASVAEAASQYRRVLARGRADGLASAKAVEELDKRVSEVLKKDGEDKPDDVVKKTDELVEEAAKLVEEGDLDPSLRDRLDDVAAQLRRLA